MSAYEILMIVFTVMGLLIAISRKNNRPAPTLTERFIA